VNALPGAVPLLPTYDVNRMAAEAQSLRDLRWQAQRAYGSDGVFRETGIDWRILPLRAPGGDPDRTDPGGAGLVGHADTPYLDRAPYFAEILAGIPAPLRSARLMALGPGAQIEEHRDGKCGFPWGVARLHVPVITNPGAEVVIDGQSRHWDAGRLWFGDFNRPHYVRNTGDQPRVHLVIDVMVTRALLELFPATYRQELPLMDVLFAREPVPLRDDDLAGLRCTLPVPAQFPQWSEDEEEYEPGPDRAGAVDMVDGIPVLSLDGQPCFGLVHTGLGEFRFEGWTEERTLHLDLSGPEPRARFRTRNGHRLTEWIRQVSI
jgi:hypothetical protein